MTEVFQTEAYRELLIERKAALIKQANALEAQSRAIRQEVAALNKITKIDSNSEQTV